MPSINADVPANTLLALETRPAHVRPAEYFQHPQQDNTVSISLKSDLLPRSSEAPRPYETPIGTILPKQDNVLPIEGLTITRSSEPVSAFIDKGRVVETGPVRSASFRADFGAMNVSLRSYSGLTSENTAVDARAGIERPLVTMPQGKLLGRVAFRQCFGPEDAGPALPSAGIEVGLRLPTDVVDVDVAAGFGGATFSKLSSTEVRVGRELARFDGRTVDVSLEAAVTASYRFEDRHDECSVAPQLRVSANAVGTELSLSAGVIEDVVSSGQRRQGQNWMVSIGAKRRF